MSLSVALHGGTVYAPARPDITNNLDRAPLFDWLIFGLHLFITPTFVFVGGFLAVLLLNRQTPASFLWKRFLHKVIPLVAIALRFNMVAHDLRSGDAGGTASAIGWLGTPEFVPVWTSGRWQLLVWCLVSLIPMFGLAAASLLAIPADSPLRQRAVTVSDRFGNLIGGSASFALGLVILAFLDTVNYAGFSKMPGAYDLIAPGLQSWHKLTAEFPFFAVGVMAALSPRLLEALTRRRWWMPYPQPGQGFAWGLVMIFLNEMTIWTLILFVLQFFNRCFSKGGPRTTWRADCALRMFLFHHGLTYAYGRLLVGMAWPIWAAFALLTVAVAATVIARHKLVVRRVPLIRLLANGKTDVAQIRRQPGLIGAFFPAASRKAREGGALSPS
jgi:multidrug transporter EmrE-like cation transporter